MGSPSSRGKGNQGLRDWCSADYVRPKCHRPAGSALQALGVSEGSLRGLAALSMVMSDPRVQSLTSALGQAQMRDQGALVLAPTPIR